MHDPHVSDLQGLKPYLFRVLLLAPIAGWGTVAWAVTNGDFGTGDTTGWTQAATDDDDNLVSPPISVRVGWMGQTGP